MQHNANSPAQGLTLWLFPKKLPYPHWDWIGAVLGTVNGIHCQVIPAGHCLKGTHRRLGTHRKSILSGMLPD